MIVCVQSASQITFQHEFHLCPLTGVLSASTGQTHSVKSKTAFAALVIALVSYNLGGISVIVTTFMKAHALSRVLTDIQNMKSRLNVKEESWSMGLYYVIPIVFFAGTGAFFLHRLSPLSPMMAFTLVFNALPYSNAFAFIPFLVVYCSQSLSRTYKQLEIRMREVRHALRDIPEEERKMKEILEDLSSTLGLHCIVILLICIIVTTASLYMVLIEVDYRQTSSQIWNELSPFLVLVLSVWIPSLIVLHGSQIVTSSV